MRGTNAHWRFVFLLWFFVPSFPPTLPVGTLLHCLSVTSSPAPSLSFLLLLPVSSIAGSFPRAFCFSCWSPCLDLASLLPRGCSCPSLGSVAPCSPKWSRLLPSSDTPENLAQALLTSQTAEPLPEEERLASLLLESSRVQLAEA